MKNLTIGLGLSLLAASVFSACGGSKTPDPNESKNKTESASPALPAGSAPNYRFINFEEICNKYNLAIDFTEQMMRLQNNYDAQEKQLGSNFQSRYNTFMDKQDKLSQERVQNPLDVEALQKEGEQLQKYYQTSQESLGKLQMEIINTRDRNAKVIMDSLKNYLQVYVAAKGYEAVFFSDNSPYYHPSLDVTEEVVEGLNARYNKVKK